MKLAPADLKRLADALAAFTATTAETGIQFAAHAPTSVAYNERGDSVEVTWDRDQSAYVVEDR